MGIRGQGRGDLFSNQKALASKHLRLRITKAAELLVYKQLSTQAEANALGASLLSEHRKAVGLQSFYKVTMPWTWEGRADRYTEAAHKGSGKGLQDECPGRTL